MTKIQKKKNPFLPLVWIPVQLVLGLLFIRFGIYLDTSAVPDPDAVIGHPVPIFTVFAMITAGLVTAVVVSVSLVRTIIRLRRERKETEE